MSVSLKNNTSNKQMFFRHFTYFLTTVKVGQQKSHRKVYYKDKGFRYFFSFLLVKYIINN